MLIRRKFKEEITLKTLLTFSGNHKTSITPASALKYNEKLAGIFRAHHDHDAIDIILPGFPYKSANTRDKVLGKLPDLGEEVALARLEKLRRTLARKLDRPMRIVICSDGAAFNDLKHISDEDVMHYRTALKSMMAHYPNMEMKSLDDLMPDMGANTDDRRNALMKSFGTDPNEVKASLPDDPKLTTLYNALTLFAKHDLIKHDNESNKAFERRCKNTALNVVARSKAWAGLIADRYPNAIRLTIHPYTDVSEKFPISLVPSIDGRWRTPWHNVPVVTGATPFNTAVKITPKKDAEASGAVLNHRNERPWCYTSCETKTMEHVLMHSCM